MRALSAPVSGVLICALPLSIFAQASPPPQNFRRDIPAKIGTSARFLVYLHVSALKEWVDLVEEWAKPPAGNK